MSEQRNEERRKYWREMITDQKASGLSIAQFCRDRQLNQASFYFWRKKLSAGVQSALAEAASPAFVPLPRLEPVITSNHFEISLPNGIRLSIPPRFDVSMLAMLIQTVHDVENRDA